MRVLEIEKEITRLERIRLQKQAYLNSNAADIAFEEDEREQAELTEIDEVITAFKLEKARLEADARPAGVLKESGKSKRGVKVNLGAVKKISKKLTE